MSARTRLTRIINDNSRKKYKSIQLIEQEKKDQNKIWNIVRGDRVEVIGMNHIEKGKQGIVMKVLRDRNRVLIEGIHLVPKHLKGDPERGIQSRTIQIERTIPYSSVQLVDPITNQPTRVSRQMLSNGNKVRISKKSNTVIVRPDILTFRKRPFNHVVTDSCTKDIDVWEITYQFKDTSITKPKATATTTKQISE